MYRLFRRKHQPGRRPGPARWTIWEVGLIVLSLLMIAFPLYIQAYQWLYPPPVPAAELLQPRVTQTNTPNAPGTPVPPATSVPPTAAPPPYRRARHHQYRPLAVPPTAVPPTAAPPTAVPPTAAPGTSVPPTAVPPTDRANHTSHREPALTAEKVVSTSSATVGQQFSYSISVFSGSATARTISVEDEINPMLTIVGTPSASNGSCSVGGTKVTCSVSVRNGAPATITIRVQVTANATPGDRISNQAIAIDGNTTDLTGRVFVDIISQPPTNTPGSPVVPSNTPVTPGTPPSATPVYTRYAAVGYACDTRYAAVGYACDTRYAAVGYACDAEHAPPRR